MAVSLKKDAVIEQESYADFQYLASTAIGNKELLDYHEVYYRKEVQSLTVSLSLAKQDFVNFLIQNGLDVSYPVFSKVINDDIMQDISPEDSLTAVDIQSARSKNFPNEQLQQFGKVVTLYVNLLSEVKARINALYAVRLAKSQAASNLERVIALSRDFRDNISNNEETYYSVKSVYERSSDLLRALLEFKTVFIAVPPSITSNTAIDGHAANIAKYNVFYVAKKKYIAKMLDKLLVSLGEMDHPELSNEKFLATYMTALDYFGGSALVRIEPLPAQYITAVDQKDTIKANIDLIIELTIKTMNKVKLLLEDIRGTGGNIGNSDLNNMIALGSQLAKAYTNINNIDPATVEYIVHENDLNLEKAVKKVDEIKNNLQKGVENLDKAFIKFNSDALRTIANVIGYVFPFAKTGKQSISDNVREKVRNLYGGNCRFCDEVVLTDERGNPKYVKKVDYDEKTKMEKSKAFSQELTAKNPDNQTVSARS